MDLTLDQIVIAMLAANVFLILYLISAVYRYSMKKHYVYASLLVFPLFLSVLSSLLFSYGLAYPYLNEQTGQKNIGHITSQTIERNTLVIRTDKYYTIIMNKTSTCPPDEIDKLDELKLVSYSQGNKKVKFPVADVTKSPVCDIVDLRSPKHK